MKMDTGMDTSKDTETAILTTIGTTTTDGIRRGMDTTIGFMSPITMVTTVTTDPGTDGM